jgi:hypothetical protein
MPPPVVRCCARRPTHSAPSPPRPSAMISPAQSSTPPYLPGSDTSRIRTASAGASPTHARTAASAPASTDTPVVPGNVLRRAGRERFSSS